MPIAALLLALIPPPTSQEPVDLAGPLVPCGVLRLEIVDEAGEPMPGRLTFVDQEGRAPKLFPLVHAAPDELAVRRNVVYSLAGRGAIRVPVGSWTVYATRGIEWSRASAELSFAEGEEVAWRAELVHEVDTAGWISADFHLHTRTFSGHGDANLKERVICMIGEGLELAVATDHNHHTDYQPTLDELEAGERVTAVTGNEVSTPLGHFNAFPMEPGGVVPDHTLGDANAIFKLIRASENRFGVVPVVQLNHPRRSWKDYLSQTRLDPVTGRCEDPRFSWDFDSLEVFNSNEGWGYYDADVDEVKRGSSVHCVLRDWFHMLNRGRRFAAVGNSDSHTVLYRFAGYPRNFVASPAAEPGAIDPVQAVEALRAKRVFTTFGPFVECWVNDEPMGSELTDTDNLVDLRIRVQAASWIDCDRVLIVVNGSVAGEIAVPDTREPLRMDGTFQVGLGHDSWISLIVEGDDPLDPIVAGGHRPALPLAVLNPVWIDVDGDGLWAAPRDQALEAAKGALDLAGWMRIEGSLLPSEKVLLLLAAGELGGESATSYVSFAFLSPDRDVALAAARSAERIAAPELAEFIDRAWNRRRRASGPIEDPYVDIALLRARRACGEQSIVPLLKQLVEGIPADRAGQYGPELNELMGRRFVEDWLVLGYLPAPEPAGSIEGGFDPEGPFEPDASWPGKGDQPLRWREVQTGADGYLDLRRFGPDRDLAPDSVAYAQTWLRGEAAGWVDYTLGTDDGCRLWVNGEQVLEDAERHAADPLQHLGRLRLEAGWNRVLLEVSNHSGSFGAYFRILDEDIRWSARRP